MGTVMVCVPSVLFDHLKRNAAAHGGQLYHWAARALDSGDDFLRDGQVHGRAHCVVTDRVTLARTRPWDARAASALSGGASGDEVALRGDVVHHALLLRLPVEALHQAQVDIDGGG